MNKIIGMILAGTFVVGTAVAEEVMAEGTVQLGGPHSADFGDGDNGVQEPDAIQIIGTSKKDIGYIVQNRNIVTIQYRVQFKGYYVECVSITIPSEDGTKLTHGYNRCTEFVNK